VLFLDAVSAAAELQALLDTVQLARALFRDGFHGVRSGRSIL
jgi:hypothetical protein